MNTKVNYIGVFKRGARLNLEKYHMCPTDMFESYYEMFTGDMPSSWKEKLGPAKKSGWDCTLYVCNRKTMEETVGKFVYSVKKVPEYEKILLSEIPRRNWYDMMAMEFEEQY